MRSSISSSERVELWVVLTLLGLLALAELGMRTLGPSWSSELRHAQELPAKVARLKAAPERSILILGNSLAIDDVRLPQLQGALPQGEQAPTVAVVAFDGASFRVLFWLFRTYFHDAGVRPDLLVLPVNAGTVGLNELRIPRLATLLRGHPFLEFAAAELSGPEEWGCFLHSLAFESYASGVRVRALALTALVPYYRAGMTRLKDLRQGGSSPLRSRWTLKPLTRMLESLAAWRTSTVLVYMPVAEVNQIHPEVAAAATRTGAVLLDHRLVPGLGPEDFKDWSHLNEGGARKFSAVLGTSLATVLNSRDGRPRRP